jgi:tRNA(fMet)-specific endonuclease VapC
VTLSLDTNVLIDLARRRPQVRSRYKEAVAAGAPMAISSVVWHELWLGVLLSRAPETEQARLAEPTYGLQRVELSFADAEAAATIRAALRPKGEEIGVFDTLIAGQALARGWTLVTANTREFDRVEGLSVVDWARPRED